MACQKGCKEGS